MNNISINDFQYRSGHPPVATVMNASTITIPPSLYLILFCLLSWTPGHAAEKWNDPHNYYLATAQNRGDLLHNVEKYHLPQGLEKLRQKKYRRAWEDFDFILRYYPNHPKGLLYMSDLSLRMNKPVQAEKYFQKAFKLYPGYADTHALYGIFLQKSGKLDEAIRQYKKALSLAPDSSETHYNLGLALYNKGDYEGALQHARVAYQLGFPLPGLRKKLRKIGKWTPATQDNASK